MMDGAMPIGLVPYYNLLWRGSTLYLPAIAGLFFLLRTIMQDARSVVGRCRRHGDDLNSMDKQINMQK